MSTPLSSYVLGRGNAAIRDFDKNRRPIRRDIVKMAMTNQEYLSLSATHSAHVAVEFFRNQALNLVCLFHTNNRHTGAKALDSSSQLTGVPGPVWMRSVHNKNPPKRQYPDVLSCGCPLDQSLHMFFLWKTLKVKSQRPNLSEYTYTMGVREVLQTPRVPDNQFRSFWIHSLEKTNHISVFALYQGNTSPAQAKINLKLRQFQALEKVLRGLGMPLSISIQDDADAEETARWQQMYRDVMGTTAGDSNEKVMADARANAMLKVCLYFPKYFTGPSSSSK